MKLFQRLFVLFLIMFAAGLKSQASDIMGADMTYRCLGNDSFEFTTVVYKDCKANWQIPAGTYNLQVSAIGCSFTPFSASPVLISCQDITPICASSCTQCQSTCNSSSSNQSCSFPYGIEKLTFRKVIYLGGTSCCKFNIGYIGNSTRNYATTTCCNADLFYTNVILDRCVTPCNSSPIFTNNPVGIICANQDFAFNNGAMDTLDGDSLSFELAPALSSETSTANYFGSFTYLRPLNFLGYPNVGLQPPGGFHLDPLTGDMSFRPTVANQISVIVIKVKEWRMVNGVMTVISENRRDMQFIVVSCPNNRVPRIRPDYSAEVCAGQKICMPIITEDDDLGDTVRISWNKGIADATFSNNNGTVRLASGEVCWTPDDSKVSSLPYIFTVTAKDNACPLSGQTIKSFRIFVRETPKATIKTTVLNCGKVAVHYTPQKQYSGLSKEWVIRNSNNVSVWSSRQQSDTAFLQPGTYIATLTLTTLTPCFNIFKDTIIVPDFVKVVLPNDTSVCMGNPVNIISRTIGGKTPYEYNWYELKTDSSAATSLATTPNYQVTPIEKVSYILQVKDGDGCYNWDSIRLSPNNPPPVNLGPDKRICQGDQVTIDAGNDTLALRYLWSTNDTTRTITVRDSNTYTVRVYDNIGCWYKDTFNLFVNIVKPVLSNNLTVCQNEVANLSVTGADNYQWYNLNGFTMNPLPPPLATGNTYSPTITQTSQFIVRGERTYMGVTCYGFDTIRVTMNPLPVVDLGTGGPYCENANPVSLFGLINFPTLQNGTWRSDVDPNIISNNFFNPKIAGVNSNPNGHPVIYRVTDANGCSNEKTTFVKVSPIPTVASADTSHLCAYSPDINLRTLQTRPLSTFDGVVDWYSLNNNPAVNNNLNKTDNQNIRLRVNNLPAGNYPLVYRFTSNQGGCTNTDTTIVRVKAIPATTAGVVPPVCWNAATVNLNTASGASPSGGTWTSPDITILSGNSYSPSSLGTAAKFVNTNVWFRYEVTIEGCTKADSIQGIIRGIPNVQLNRFAGLCVDTSFDLSSLGTPNSPAGTWSGPGVNGSSFSAATAGPGAHRLRYDYTNPATGCSNSDSFNFTIQDKPSVTFNTPKASCAGNNFPLNVTLNNAYGIIWSRLGDGVFDAATSGNTTSTQTNTTYFPGTGDINNQGFRIRAITQSSMSFCPAAQIDQEIKIYPIPDIAIDAKPLEDCEPLSVNFEAITNAAPGAYLSWDFGNGVTLNGKDNVRTHTETYPAGSYTVNLTIHSDSAFGYCRNEASPVTVKVYPAPNAAMAASRWKTTVALPEIQFSDKSTIAPGGTINVWQWSFGDRNNSTSQEQNPHFRYPISEPSDTGIFLVTLRVETPDKCWDTATGYINIQPDITVFIPNAFTPNLFGEKMNERFYVIADGFETFEITIFNRWGEKIYASDNILEGWDGKFRGVEVQNDVYVYVVRVTAIGGKEYEYYGTITLLR